MGTHNSVVVLNEILQFFLALFFVSDDFLIQAFDTDNSQSKMYYLKAHKMCFQMMLSFFLLLVC